MIEIPLYLIAVALLVRLAFVTRRAVQPVPQTTAAAEPADPQRGRRYRDVFIPLACGTAVTFDGRTDNCARRPRHQGRCMCEDELAAAADQTTIVPAPQDENRDVDLAALGRHVDTCPVSIHQNGKLSIEEQAWLLRTRLMIDALVTGERFSEWGDTRG